MQYSWVRVLILLAPSPNSLPPRCCQFIQIDAGHLKGQWKGIMIVATGKVTNNSLVLLAFCICDRENESNYSYFLRSMKQNPTMADLLSSPKTTIYSDEHLGIAAGVAREAPACIHRLCLMHLVRNFPGPGIGSVRHHLTVCLNYQSGIAVQEFRCSLLL